MKVYLNSITGIADAIVTMYMSKRTWTRELEVEIRSLCNRVLDNNGFVNTETEIAQEDWDKFSDLLAKVCKWGTKHITMLRYIDLSVTVEGLHRAGQDDFDSHAKRLENRIIRSSTRLAEFKNGEKSEWYQDKILYLGEVLDQLGIVLPESVVKDGVTFVKTDFGYVREDLQKSKDAKRGLYPLAIPSDFTFKVNLTELSHIVKERDKNSTANAELQIMIEDLKVLLGNAHPVMLENLYTIKN